MSFNAKKTEFSSQSLFEMKRSRKFLTASVFVCEIFIALQIVCQTEVSAILKCPKNKFLA